MNPRLPGIGSELALSVRKVNAAYHRLPESCRPDILGEMWTKLEVELDRRCAADDREGALQAIAAWHQHAISVIEEARS